MKTNKKRGFTLIELMIVVAIIGILAAIAIPNFIKFQARSKQGEAKANLKSLFTAQKSYFQEYDRYDELIAAIGFAPERGNRYAYYNGGGATNQVRAAVDPVSTATDTGIEIDIFKFDTITDGTPTYAGIVPAFGAIGTDPSWPGVDQTNGCPDCNFAGQAVGNVDSEAVGQDQWFISSKDAAAASLCPIVADVPAPAGIPLNQYNDVDCDVP